jgi:hypothetical protein
VVNVFSPVTVFISASRAQNHQTGKGMKSSCQKQPAIDRLSGMLSYRADAFYRFYQF